MGSDASQVTYHILYANEKGILDVLLWTKPLPYHSSFPDSYDLPANFKLLYIVKNPEELLIIRPMENL